MAKFRFRPRKWLAQLVYKLQRRLQYVLFFAFFVAEVTASAVLFHASPLSGLCIWYPSGVTYGLGHFIVTLGLYLLITVGWWFIGNPAFWEAICRSKERSRMLFNVGLAGLGIDLVSSMVLYYVSPRAETPHLWSAEGLAQPLLLRGGVWAVTYLVTGWICIGLLKLNVQSRQVMSPEKS